MVAIPLGEDRRECDDDAPVMVDAEKAAAEDVVLDPMDSPESGRLLRAKRDDLLPP